MSENTAQYMTGDMSQEVKITDMTVIELKAAALDLLVEQNGLQVRINQLQQSINELMAEIDRRSRAA
jgi:hypothetical protein